MIQFNLLPDVKLNYVKTNRLKHTIIVISIIVAFLSALSFILLFVTVNVIQKNNLNNLNNTINSSVSTLKNTPNLNSTLTIQAELNSLSTLHSQKPITTRLAGYLQQITPNKVTISQFGTTFTNSANQTNTNQITIQGAAPDLTTVNQFVDILKLCSYTSTKSTTPKNAFLNVELSTFSYDTRTGASYSITTNFDPAIFADASTTVTLNIPSDSITHSTAVQSQDLFAPTPTPGTGH